MIDRGYGWTADYIQSGGGRVEVRLAHVDVGDVRGGLHVTADDDPTNPTTVVLAPFHPDELDELAEVIRDAADAARRWSVETSR